MDVPGGAMKSGSLLAGTTLVVLFVVRTLHAYVERLSAGGFATAASLETAAITGVATLAICAVLAGVWREPTDAITARSLDRPLSAFAVGAASVAVVGAAGYGLVRTFAALSTAALELGVAPLSVAAVAVVVVGAAVAAAAGLFVLAVVLASTAFGYLACGRLVAGRYGRAPTVGLAGLLAGGVVLVPTAGIVLETAVTILAVGAFVLGLEFRVRGPWAIDDREPDEAEFPT